MADGQLVWEKGRRISTDFYGTGLQDLVIVKVSDDV
jgi:hypothetical protein